MSNIEVVTKELHKAFRLLNKQFFNNELPEPAITIQTSGKRLAMGWCTNAEVWEDKEGKIKKYELNISAEYLHIEFMETMDTMMHEMVHLYNSVKNIKDTSRNGTYHNKQFKAECMRRGFYFPDSKPDKKYGWAFPKLTEDTKEIIASLDIDQNVFVIARNIPSKSQGGSKSNSFKWVCPGCNSTVRSTKEDVYLRCKLCNEDFQLEEK